MPTSPEELASPSGKRFDFESNNNRGGADPVGGEDDAGGPLSLLLSVPVDVDHAAGTPALVDDDLTSPCAGHEAGAVADRRRPVREVGRALRALRTTGGTGTPPHARTQIAVRAGWNRVAGRPPIPAQLVHPLGSLPPKGADGDRREGRSRSGRVHGVAAEAGDAHLEVHALIERGEIAVRDRPVVTDSVRRSDTKVLGPHPRPLGAVVNRAPADGVVHDGAHFRLRHLARVVLARPAHIRVGAPAAVGQKFPLGLVARVVRSTEPVALFEADDIETGCSQVPGRDPSGCPGADDHDVGPVSRTRRTCTRDRPGTGGRDRIRGARRGLGRPDRLPPVPAEHRIEQSVTEVVLCFVDVDRVLGLTRVADQSSDLGVHIVSGADYAGEHIEIVRPLRLQAADGLVRATAGRPGDDRVQRLD